jgi:CDP-diacylglycerol pyrophosphatase
MPSQHLPEFPVNEPNAELTGKSDLHSHPSPSAHESRNLRDPIPGKRVACRRRNGKLSPQRRAEDRLRRLLPVPVVGLGLLLWCLTVPVRAQSAQPAAPAGKPAAVCNVARPPNSLWSLARCCARDLSSDKDCRYYSKTNDFIILKDHSPAKPDAYLIIPTTKVVGIEDQRIFAQPVADFWAYGWQQGQIYIKKPAADTALAINSKFGRTQDQLHIHISCARRDVAQALAENEDRIGSDPAKPVELRLGPQGHIYRAIKVTSLVAKSPFDLAAEMPGAKADMAAHSIAVVGSKTPGVYFVLDNYHHGSNPGAAEELLDQSCR